MRRIMALMMEIEVEGRVILSMLSPYPATVVHLFAEEE
jgi:hypothetical protein